MKLYAIRDRLLDYYMVPFAGNDHKQVMGAVATTINREDSNDQIAAQPYHFEIWQIGEVDHDGNLTPNKALICNCSSLVRNGVRNGTQDRPGAGKSEIPANAIPPAPSGAGGNAAANDRPPENAPHTAAGSGREDGQGPGGVPPNHAGH